MSLPYPNPANMTEGLANFVAMALAEVKSGDMDGAERILVDLLNDIGCAYVCQEKPELPTPAVMPEYNPATDGDYSAWLAANNID